MVQNISSLFDLLAQLSSGQAPWWLYAVIIFIPFSILIAIREAYCWFNKVNSVVSRLDRLDLRLKELQKSILSLNDTISNSVPKNGSRPEQINEKK